MTAIDNPTPSPNSEKNQASSGFHSKEEEPAKSKPKTRAFWLSFAAIMVAVFLSALDLTAVGTALPTIANALKDTKGNYIWVCASL